MVLSSQPKMAHSSFRFKQFTVDQQNCAMKVTTLACIQGAWLPAIKPKRVLDVGAGTGLLTLMAAQRYQAQIDAVEIDGKAFTTMKSNFEASPWSDRIQAYHQCIRQFAAQCTLTYDLIVTNPPFYERQRRSENPLVNLARHDLGLNLEELLSAINKLLAPDGSCSLLLPVRQTEKLLAETARRPFYALRQLYIADSCKHPTQAVITVFSRAAGHLMQEHLHIKNQNRGFHRKYRSLLRPYYLNI
jgi:tRNA1Val (adenine37-N6)-methyltransferase